MPWVSLGCVYQAESAIYSSLFDTKGGGTPLECCRMCQSQKSASKANSAATKSRTRAELVSPDLNMSNTTRVAV